MSRLDNMKFQSTTFCSSVESIRPYPGKSPGAGLVSRPPDGGYGWVVVACSFVIQAVSGGIAFSVGVFYVEFLHTFQESKGATAMIGSLNTGLLFGAGPIASVLTNRFGHRAIVTVGCLMAGSGLLASAFATSIYFLFFTYGILAGFGFCLMYIPSVVIVGLYFDKRRNLAMGLAVSGFGCGSLVFAPLLRILIVTQGWRGAMILTAGCCVQACVFGALLSPVEVWMKPKPLKPHVRDSYGFHDLCSVSLLRDLKFILFMLNNILWNIGSLILFVIITDYAHICAISKNHGAWLVSSIGLSSLIGRILVAILASHKRCNRFILFIVSTAISGIAICLFPSSEDFIAMMSYSALYGLFFGIQLGVLAVVTTEIFGVERLTSAYGYLMFGNGTGALLGPPIAGWAYDATKDYRLSFYIGGGVTILSAIILICIPVLQKMEGKSTLQPVIYGEDITVSNGKITVSNGKIPNGDSPCDYV